jgi:hypothetical protein
VPSTGWTPRIVPYDADQTIYLVVDRFGRHGSVYRETEVERTKTKGKEVAPVPVSVGVLPAPGRTGPQSENPIR